MSDYTPPTPVQVDIIYVRIDAVVHSVYWNVHHSPLGSVTMARRRIYHEDLPPCCRTPIRNIDVHPAAAPVTCFWCAAYGPDY